MTEVLSLDRIATLLSTTKQRGVYEGYIQNHVDSGELAVNISELAYAKGKDVASVRNSIAGNIKAKTTENEWPALTVLLDKSDKDNVKVILINMDVLVAQQAELTDDTDSEV